MRRCRLGVRALAPGSAIGFDPYLRANEWSAPPKISCHRTPSKTTSTTALSARSSFTGGTGAGGASNTSGSRDATGDVGAAPQVAPSPATTETGIASARSATNLRSTRCKTFPRSVSCVGSIGQKVVALSCVTLLGSSAQGFADGARGGTLAFACQRGVLRTMVAPRDSADSAHRSRTPTRTSQKVLALLLVPVALAVTGGLLALRVHFQPPTVPTYIVAPPSQTLLRPGGRFEVELRPTAHVDGAVAIRAFLLRGDEVRPWDPPFEVSRDGSVRIAGAVDTLFSGVPSGDWDMAFAVGRPETLPTAPRTILRARDDARSETGAAAWRLVRAPVALRELLAEKPEAGYEP